MVEDDVSVDLEFLVVQCLNRFEILIAGTVLGTNRVFLVKFPHIVQVIDAVPDIVYAGLPLVRGRQPDRSKPAMFPLIKMVLCSFCRRFFSVFSATVNPIKGSAGGGRGLEEADSVPVYALVPMIANSSEFRSYGAPVTSE